MLVDNGTSRIFEVITDVSDAGGTITVPEGMPLPPTFTVYFDERQTVGRVCAIQSTVPIPTE
jgi:hypothetical protein